MTLTGARGLLAVAAVTLAHGAALGAMVLRYTVGRANFAAHEAANTASLAAEATADFTVNNSPFAWQSGKYVTTRQVRDRLYKELERNVALRVEETSSPDTHSVSGRGELHLGILMETMRREGYEFQVSRPRVITKIGPNGERLEPYEELMIDVPEEFMGVVMEKLGPRRAEMTEMRPPGLSRSIPPAMAR